MKSIFAFFIFFSLLLVFAKLSYARKEPGDYWKSIMKDQPIPEAIKDLFNDNPASDARKMDHFVRDFDIKPNAIIYHNHAEHKEEKPFVKQIKPGLKVPSHSWDKKEQIIEQYN